MNKESTRKQTSHRIAQASARDIQQALSLAAAVVGMAGLVLGLFGKRRYLLLSALSLGLLYQQTAKESALRAADAAPDHH